MRSDDALRQLAYAHGIHAAYDSWTGDREVAQPPTLRALLTGLGIDATSEGAVRDALDHHEAEHATRLLPIDHVALAGTSLTFSVDQPSEWRVEDEDGKEQEAGRSEGPIQLAALPVGYFILTARFSDREERVFLLSRPEAAPDLVSRFGAARTWGISGALYALRSATNGGVGNFHDLGATMQAFGQCGAQYFGINPIHALGWAADDTISPYSPSHRGFYNIDHIWTETGLDPLQCLSIIDYSRFRRVHRAALEAGYREFAENNDTPAYAAFQTYCRAAGPDLDSFATFESQSERHGADFRVWSARSQSRDTAPVTPRDQFHKWLQWRADTQIDQAILQARDGGMSLGLYLDLAVGARPGGAEVWMHEGIVAQGISIGAPPDHLSPAGQSWTLAAYAPNKLRQNRYDPIRTLLRKLMAKAGILRIDHALGLLRSFWVPEDGSPGGYISQPFDALLAIVAIEASQSGCLVVGEDLGLVPDGFRERLNGSGLYSYAVWQYEMEDDGALLPPSRLRPFSMACFGTHDTPTMRGFWRGRDIEWWRDLGWLTGTDAERAHSRRAHQRNSLRRMCRLRPEADLTAIQSTVHEELAGSPAAMVTVQLDDILGVEEAQNLPGTIDEHPNWRRPAPVDIEAFPATPGLGNVTRAMQSRGQPED